MPFGAAGQGPVTDPVGRSTGAIEFFTTTKPPTPARSPIKCQNHQHGFSPGITATYKRTVSATPARRPSPPRSGADAGAWQSTCPPGRRCVAGVHRQSRWRVPIDVDGNSLIDMGSGIAVTTVEREPT